MPSMADTQATASTLAALLASRLDAASIIAAVAAQLMPLDPTDQLPAESGFEDSPPPLSVDTVEPPVGTPFSAMKTMELRWCVKHGSAVEVAAARAALRMLYDEEQDGDAEFARAIQWREHHTSPQTESPPTEPPPASLSPVKPKAFSFASQQIPPQPSPPAIQPASLPLLDAASLLDTYRTSPEFTLIRKTVSSPVDLTLSQWFTRALYISDVADAWKKWSDPSSPPHRDAPDALSAFAEAASLDVPDDLLDSHPDTAATAWDCYRGKLINSFHRALVAGVDWRQALRHLVIRYKDPRYGHPRLVDYVAEALHDPCLLDNPPLHADVLIRQLDESFSANSTKFKQFSVSAEWDATTARRAGEDCLSLARRVVKAYVRKLNDPTITAATVQNTEYHLYEISTRFGECLFTDPTDPDRGQYLRKRFDDVYGEHLQRFVAGEIGIEELSCLRLARVYLGTSENTYQRSHGTPDTTVALADHGAEPAPAPARHDFAPPLTYRHRPAGRGSRERRTAQRALLQQQLEKLDQIDDDE